MLIGERNGMAVKPKWKNPYVTNGLIAMWDGEWNADGGVHKNDSNIVDLTGNCSNLILSSGLLIHEETVGGLKCLEEATFACSSNSVINTAVKEIVYDSTKAITVQLVCYMVDVSSRNSVVFSSIGSVGSSFPCFYLGCEKIPSNSLIRCNGKAAGSSVSQSNISTNTYPVACCQLVISGGMVYQSSISINYGDNESVGSLITAQLASRLPNEPDLVERCITSGKVSITLPIGAVLLSTRFYSRTLTSDEISTNYAIDKLRFDLNSSTSNRGGVGVIS